MSKRIVISPEKPERRLIEHARSLGIRDLYLKSADASEELRRNFTLYLERDGVVEIVEGEASERAVKLRIEEVEDVEKVVEAARRGAKTIFVETPSWKIIPLENLVADLQRTGTKLYSYSSGLDDLETLIGVLERGVDGVVVNVSGVEEMENVVAMLRNVKRLALSYAEVTEVKAVGMGDRVCVDTTSILNFGEGMLVGNTAQLFFLVHNENVESPFSAPRPFRVNAGAVHCYTMTPDGTTKYLSEVSSGMRVLIVSSNGDARSATVGRVKIERRPMRLVRARSKEAEGSVILQDAETIRLVGEDGKLRSVTDLEVGDRVLVHVSEQKARHFGKAVDEFVIER